MNVDKEQRSRCFKFFFYTWKVSSCIFSHFMMICLVIAYCILGAFTFEKLEAANEREQKLNIPKIRNNVTHSIWKMTVNSPVLRQENWTEDVVEKLKDFERNIVKAMKHDGWDGSEQLDTAQWTFTGALFYSIIVITMIGYGHIAPKTLYGKVVTIFYAILGIPLMLICLSNIGDVMASSFRFLYWRVCCYMCTRPPKKRKSRHRSLSRMPSRSHSSRRRPRSLPLERSRNMDCARRRSLRSSRGAPPDKRDRVQNSIEERQSALVDRRNLMQQRQYSLPQRYFSHPLPSSNADYRKNMRRVKSYHAEMSRNHLEFQELDDRKKDQYCESSDEVLEDLDAVFKALKIERRSKPGDYRSKSLPRPNKRSMNTDTKIIYNTYRRAADIEDDCEIRDLGSVDYKNYLEKKKKEELNDNNGQSKETVIGMDDEKSFNEIYEKFKGSRLNVDNRNNGCLRDNSHFDYEIDRPLHRHGFIPDKKPECQCASRGYKREFSDNENYHSRNNHFTGQRGIRRGYSDLDYNLRDFERDYIDLHHRPELKRGFSDIDYRNLPRGYRRYDPMNRIERDRRTQSDCFDYGRGSEYDTIRRTGQKTYARPSEHFGDARFDRKYYSLTPERKFPHRWNNSDEDEESDHFRRSKIIDDVQPRMYGKEVYSDSVQALQKAQAVKPVPIWLCVLLVISYIIAGSFLFHKWEGWKFLDSAYFCFITLTTIGFGDFVPAQGVKANSEVSIALCSLYLLLGISLLAMSLNLVQEEVIANVKAVARKLGIIKRSSDDCNSV